MTSLWTFPMTSPSFWTLLTVVAALFSGFWGRRLEKWWDTPRLAVEFIPDEQGFRTEGTWKEGDTEITEIYIRVRVRNLGRSVAKQCRPFLVKLEEVHPSGRPR